MDAAEANVEEGVKNKDIIDISDDEEVIDFNEDFEYKQKDMNSESNAKNDFNSYQCNVCGKHLNHITSLSEHVNAKHVMI